MSDAEQTPEDAVAATNAWSAKIIEEFRANAVRVGGAFDGASVALLHTKGARTKAPRVNPLVYLRDDERVYVFASKAGADTNPDWYHNLVATPQVEMEIGSDRYSATAVLVTGAERDRIFAAQVDRNPGFADYEAKTARIIPVVELVRS